MVRRYHHHLHPEPLHLTSVTSPRLLANTSLEVRLDHINRQTRTQFIDRNKSAIGELIKWRRINQSLTSQHASRKIVGAGTSHDPGLRCAGQAGHSAGFHAGAVDFEHVGEFHSMHWSLIGAPCWVGAGEGDEDADCCKILHFDGFGGLGSVG